MKRTGEAVGAERPPMPAGRRPRLALWSLLVFLGASLVGVPDVIAPEWAGTEARRAAITEEMAWSGDWVVPTLGNLPTLAKPPLFYWVGTLFTDAAGRLPPWRARLPGTLALAALAVLVLHVGARVCSPRVGLLSALALITMPWFGMQLGSAEIDPLFSALLGAAILLLMIEASVAGPPPWVMPGAGILLGLALLTKEQPVLMFVVPVFLVRPRGWRPARLALLAGTALVVVLPWLLAVWDRVGFAPFWSKARAESIGRSAAYTLADLLLVPGHIVAAPLRFLPWVVLLPAILRPAELRREGARRFAVLLPIAAYAGAVIALCFFPSRSSRYLAPALGPMALPLGLALDRGLRAEAGARGALVLPALGMLMGLLLLAAAAEPLARWLPALASRSQTPGWWMGAVPPALLLSGVIAALPRGRNGRLIAASALMMMQVFAWSLDLGRREGGLSRAFGPQVRALLPHLPQGVSFYGHVSSQFLVALRPHPMQDEDMTAAPGTRWILFEDADNKPGEVQRVLAKKQAPFRERKRLRLGNRSLVLAEMAAR